MKATGANSQALENSGFELLGWLVGMGSDPPLRRLQLAFRRALHSRSSRPSHGVTLEISPPRRMSFAFGGVGLLIGNPVAGALLDKYGWIAPPMFCFVGRLIFWRLISFWLRG
jgi:hypothetical protein